MLGSHVGTSVVDRHIFYNNSAFDDNDPDPSAADDNAIATDKMPLLPADSIPATFDNYTSYSRGINGIMIDFVGLRVGYTPVAADFEFKVGNNNDQSSWTDAPNPTGIAVREGEGTGGSDRVTIVWEDNAIVNQWLQVTVKTGTQIGLDGEDVFCLGNAVAEAGNSTIDAKVTVVDLLLARNNPRSLFDNIDATFPFDYDRNREVNATDVLLARNHQTSFFNDLELIDLSATAVEAQQVPMAGLVWFFDYDQATARRPVEKAASATAVDKLLATYWP